MTVPLKKRLVRQRPKDAAGEQAKQTLHSVLRDAIESAIHDLEDFAITSPQQSKRIEEAAKRAVQSLNPILYSTSPGSLGSHTRYSLSDSSWNGSENGHFYDDVDGTFLQILTRTKERYHSKPASPPKRAVIHALAHLKGLHHQTVGDGKRKSVIVSRHSSSMLSQHGSSPSADAQVSTTTGANDYEEFKKSSYQDFILYDQPIARQEQLSSGTYALATVSADMDTQAGASDDVPIIPFDTTADPTSAAQSSYCASVWSSGESFATDAEPGECIPETELQAPESPFPYATDPDWSTMSDIAKRKSNLGNMPHQRFMNIGLIDPASMRSARKERQHFAATNKRMSISSASSFSNYVSGGETMSGGSSLRSPASFDSLRANKYSLPSNFYEPKPQRIEEGYASQLDLLSLPSNEIAPYAYENDPSDPTSGICSFVLDVPPASDYSAAVSATQNEEAPAPVATRRKRQRKEDDGFPCSGCDKVFSRACDRNKHQLAHAPQNTLPYGCQRCSKSFRYPKDLKRHGRTHGGDNGKIYIGLGIA